MLYLLISLQHRALALPAWPRRWEEHWNSQTWAPPCAAGYPEDSWPPLSEEQGGRQALLRAAGTCGAKSENRRFEQWGKRIPERCGVFWHSNLTNLFHVIPVANYSIFHGVLQCQNSSHVLSIMSNVGLPFKVAIHYFLQAKNRNKWRLCKVQHVCVYPLSSATDYLILGQPNNCWENCRWKVLISKASFHQTRTCIQHDRSLIIHHLQEKGKLIEPFLYIFFSSLKFRFISNNYRSVSYLSGANMDGWLMEWCCEGSCASPTPLEAISDICMRYFNSYWFTWVREHCQRRLTYF